MKALIVGAAGMVGRKLTESLVEKPELAGSALTELVLADVVEPQAPDAAGLKISTHAADIDDPAIAPTLIAERPDIVFHLAAIVSGQAERDFELGYRINLDGTRHLFEAIRKEGLDAPYLPRVVYASSLAVYGKPLPTRIPDEFFLTPLTSYGTQKAIGELLLADYSRRGFLDGIGLRLPTINIRPGKPNQAASGFFSSILREPLSGKPAVLPVGDDLRHYHASPRAAVGFMRHAVSIDTGLLGARRNLTMPGLSATVGEQIEALRRVAGEKAVALIRREPDPDVATIVGGWAKDFEATKARELGFVAENSFDEIIRIHIEDELGGQIEI